MSSLLCTREGQPAAAQARRSDRISLELPIEVSGTDAAGQCFTESSQTLVLSHHGAKILLSRKLVPEQELTIRCPKTGRESDARVVGLTGSGPGGSHYGIEFLDPAINLWGIEFPPLSESEKAVARVLLECGHCRSRELVYLNEFEAEVFEGSKSLSRPCRRCADTSLWKQPLPEAASEQMPSRTQPPGAPQPAPTAIPRAQNERKEVRLSLKMAACIRGPQCGEEVVITENVSRDGLRFKSSKHFAVGWVMEVAVPYSRGASNIFTPVRVEHREALPTEGLTLYGLSYIPIHRGWPAK